MCCIDCFSAMSEPLVRRDSTRSHIMSKAFWATPTVRMPWCTRPPPSRVWAILKPLPSSPSRFSAGTRTSLKRR